MLGQVPAMQTCCGQPAYNSGDKADAAALARQTIAALPAHYVARRPALRGISSCLSEVLAMIGVVRQGEGV